MPWYIDFQCSLLMGGPLFTTLILTFMAALRSKDQMKFSNLKSDFSNKIFVSCHKTQFQIKGGRSVRRRDIFKVSGKRYKYFL